MRITEIFLFLENAFFPKDETSMMLFFIFHWFSMFCRDDILTQMYRKIQRMEEEGHTDRLRLNLHYRNNESKTGIGWKTDIGEIDHQWFYVEETTMPMLKPITGRFYFLVSKHSFMDSKSFEPN